MANTSGIFEESHVRSIFFEDDCPCFELENGDIKRIYVESNYGYIHIKWLTEQEQRNRIEAINKERKNRKWWKIWK